MTKIFIGGSRSAAFLKHHALERLDVIISKGYQVLVGDADGADKSIQEYLSKKAYSNVIVYCTGDNCRNNVYGWPIKNINPLKKLTGRKFYMVKDLAMAQDCDYGFMIWDDKSPGTINNVINLLFENKMSVIFLHNHDRFFNVKTVDSLDTLLKQCKPNVLEKIDKNIGLLRKLAELKDQTPVQLELTI